MRTMILTCHRGFQQLDVSSYLQDSGKLEIAHDLSRALGRPFYWFNCHRFYDSLLLHNVFKGLALTGEAAILFLHH